MALSGFSVWRLEEAVSEEEWGKKAVRAKRKEEKEHIVNGWCLATPIINTDLYQSHDEYVETLRNTNGLTL